jgi:hypothetical protein
MDKKTEPDALRRKLLDIHRVYMESGDKTEQQIEKLRVERQAIINKMIGEYRESGRESVFESSRVVRRAQPAKKQWQGTAREFGDWVLKRYRDGSIKANSQLAALKKECAKYLQKNGKPMNARSIWQSLKNRLDYEGKGPRTRRTQR